MPETRLSIQPAIIQTINRDLVPLIIEANRDSSEALRGRTDRYTEASMGYITWDHSRRAIWEVIRKLPDWRISNIENDLVLTCLAGAEDLRLRVCRVNPKTRLPTSGKRAKENAYNGPLLSEELLRFLPMHEYLIGYDTGILSGVGRITLQALWATADLMHSQTLAVLYDATVHDTQPQPTQLPEELPKGKPSRRQESPQSEPLESEK